jgi:hypothetical protein
VQQKRSEIAAELAKHLDSAPKPDPDPPTKAETTAFGTCTHPKKVQRGQFVACGDCGAIKVGPTWRPKA